MNGPEFIAIARVQDASGCEHCTPRGQTTQGGTDDHTKNIARDDGRRLTDEFQKLCRRGVFEERAAHSSDSQSPSRVEEPCLP